MQDFLSGVAKSWQGYGMAFLSGAKNTLLISLVGTLIGCVIGFLVGAVQTIPTSKKDPLWKRVLLWIVNAILKIYVEVFRGTPMIVQSVFIYYGARMLFNIHMDPLFAGFFIVSINTGAYMAETVRGGILSIDPGHWHDSRPDHDLRYFSTGFSKYHSPNRQQLHYQHKGYRRAFGNLRYRPVL